MKVLFVAVPDSIHTARWISQLIDQNWDIHLFPSMDLGFIHKEIRGVTVYHSFYSSLKNPKESSIRYKGMYLPTERLALLGRKACEKLIPGFRSIQLARLIERIKPDMVHSLRIQDSGYLALETKRKCRKKFPPWIVTNWGSDIHLYGRLSTEESRIRSVLAECDYYSCECKRDVSLAVSYGFKGTILPVFPNTGGFDLNLTYQLLHPGAPSERRSIMLKGYQTDAGRALVGLRALERSVDILAGYTIIIYSASPEVVVAGEIFQKTTGISVTVVPQYTPHQEILKLHGRSRISIGLSISDAISTSLLEAMVMGSFPIQSWTGCAEEWIEHGSTGFLVPPEDPEEIEQYIRHALTDDDLVNAASEKNRAVASERLDKNVLREKSIEIYENIYKHHHENKV